MFKLKIITLSTVFILFSNFLYAQYNNLKPLKPGDTIPDLSFKIRTGDRFSTIRISELKGKAILLDFWGVDCATCIGNMPKMLALQDEFKDKLQIIVVTPNSEIEVDTLWQQMKSYAPKSLIYAGQHLPFILSDTILKKLFPYNGVPMHIWIDSSQKFICAATDASTTTENMKSFIGGKAVKFVPYAHVDINNFNAKDWLKKRIGFNDHLLEYSFFAKYDEKATLGGYSIVSKDSLNQSLSLVTFNRTIVDLFRIAYYNNDLYQKHLVYLEVRNKNQFFEPDYNTNEDYQWALNNRFCYCVKTQDTSEIVFYKKIRNDIQNYFRLKGFFAFRNVKCIVLKRISKNYPVITHGGPLWDQKIVDYDNGKQALRIRNMPTSQLLYIISGYYFNQNNDWLYEPTFDETNYKKNIDFEIPFGHNKPSVADLSTLKQELKKNGLELVQEYRKLKVLVISDSNAKIKK